MVTLVIPDDAPCVAPKMGVPAELELRLIVKPTVVGVPAVVCS